MRSVRRMLAVLTLVSVTSPGVVAAADVAARDRAEAARAWGTSVTPSPELQAFLERTVTALEREDPKLSSAAARIAVLDLTHPGTPALAHVRGDDPVYPASVVKFVYLMAAYAWREQGRIQIDAELDAELDAMIRHSSNEATQKVFRRLTGTQAGAELDDAGYEEFRRRRLSVERWVESLGVRGLHARNPTYDGGGDLFGRDRQFLRDRSIEGGLPAAGTEVVNRNAMTANATVRLLGLLAEDRVLSPQDGAAARARMKRDVREQPYLALRIAGGAASVPGSEVFSKSGTWGPIFADAGIVRAKHDEFHGEARQFAIAVFTEAAPPYRGDAIAKLTSRLATRLLAAPGGST